MKSEIGERLDSNLARVESLIAAYDAEVRARSSGARGRVAVTTTDLLRAAVVFLHATLEDLVRSALEWRLPLAKAEFLAPVPLLNCTRGGHEPRFNLSDLAGHRGRTVDFVLDKSVQSYLGDATFNNPRQLITAVVSIGLQASLLDPYTPALGPMMARRHWIVHRTDRNEVVGQGHHVTRSISRKNVQQWLSAVRDLGADFLAALP